MDDRVVVIPSRSLRVHVVDEVLHRQRRDIVEEFDLDHIPLEPGRAGVHVHVRHEFHMRARGRRGVEHLREIDRLLHLPRAAEDVEERIAEDQGGSDAGFERFDAGGE